jgi:RNA polymerase sigma-70 factor (ECF subfamily)
MRATMAAASTAPATTNDDLAALLARIALRDQRAFERLYRATAGHLLGVATAVLMQRERAEEVLQEAYVNVWNGAAGYDPGLATPMTWLINIVRNKAIDRVRTGRAERASTVPLDEEAMAVADPDQPQPAQWLEQCVLRQHVDECLAGLSAAQRQAVALAYYRGLVHTEIAAWLDTPLGTVKAWVRRGADRLRDCLEAAGVTSA